MKKTDRLLHTYQISCLEEAGNGVDCLGSGQAGAYGPKTRNPHDRFRVLNAIVEDKWTGLVWHRDANVAEFPLSWEETFQFMLEINLYQHSVRSDWRLPKREELFSLISHQTINPCRPESHPFRSDFFFN